MNPFEALLNSLVFVIRISPSRPYHSHPRDSQVARVVELNSLARAACYDVLHVHKPTRDGFYSTWTIFLFGQRRGLRDRRDEKLPSPCIPPRLKGRNHEPLKVPTMTKLVLCPV